MASTRLLQCVGAAGLGSLSWLAGREGERRREQGLASASVQGVQGLATASVQGVQGLASVHGVPDDLLLPARRPPGLPLLSAAVAFSSNTRETGLTVPSRETSLVPPEPGPDAGRVAQIMRFGFPGLDNIRSHSDYILSYDRRNRIPHWVFEHLTRESVERTEGVDRSLCQFQEDPSVHPFFRSTKSDYKHSGFDRGHMAPAGNHRKDQAMCDQTFVLSNMAPQVGRGFNRDKWEHLERHARKLTKLYRNVYVCTGPLYLPHTEADGKMYVKYQVIGQNHVSVPTHFFKVIVGETEARDLEMEAYVLPNQVIEDSTPLEEFRVPPDSVERAAGLLFFDRLARERLTRVNGLKTGYC